MANTGNVLAETTSMGPRSTMRLVSGIAPERFARMASPAGQTVVANHPAFILGHLSLYPQKVLELLGQDTAPAAVPESYEELFSKNATCEDDPTGEKYPGAEELKSVFERTYAAAVDALQNASDEQLAVKNPVESPLQQVCTSLGSLLNFYMTSHVMLHLGQLSTWRRMEGMPPA